MTNESVGNALPQSSSNLCSGLSSELFANSLGVSPFSPLLVEENKVCGPASGTIMSWHYPLKKDSFYLKFLWGPSCDRLMRFEDGQNMYVKFKLRPCDISINEDRGKAIPTGILPQEIGAIHRDENDSRLSLSFPSKHKGKSIMNHHIEIELWLPNI
ncbi:hypothetical protein KIW84_072812 [Lathyrus oleraceus]|uniref:Uncharacterized protein n=1 Tax=Pisum sativum TaxID=3888 RepID=A0A9D4ZUU3_PEA|nr:hypothetical protein KIW84_072812 [Pisum sativum]